MLLDPMQTSKLNRLIAVRFHCNSSETKSLLNLVMCNSSARSSLHYDLDRVYRVNESTASAAVPRFALQRLAQDGEKVPSQVYHVFYSSASSDSIIYILAILCIYFLLFSLLIYANWNTFNQYNHRKKRRQRKRKFLPLHSTSTTIGALDSVVCLENTQLNKKAFAEQTSNGKEPKETNTTTLLVSSNPGKLVQI